MKIGWMWFDNDPNRTIEEKVRQAAQKYQDKFGRLPNTCYVNQAAITGPETKVGRIRVVGAPNILVHHFWLGVASQTQPGGDHGQ